MLAEVNDQNGGGRLPQKGRGHAIAAGILGWTLDTFDFFVVVFLVDLSLSWPTRSFPIF